MVREVDFVTPSMGVTTYDFDSSRAYMKRADPVDLTASAIVLIDASGSMGGGDGSPALDHFLDPKPAPKAVECGAPRGTRLTWWDAPSMGGRALISHRIMTLKPSRAWTLPWRVLHRPTGRLRPVDFRSQAHECGAKYPI